MIEDYFSFASTVRQPQNYFDIPLKSQLKESQLYQSRCQVNQAYFSLKEIISTPSDRSYHRLNSLSRSKKNRSNCLIQQNFNQFLDTQQAKKESKKDDIFEYLEEQKSNKQINNQQQNKGLDDDDNDDEEEEYSIWDNSQLQEQGFDCEHFYNKEGKELSFYQLYRIRQCQLLGHVPIQKTIENFSIIYQLYLEPIEKSEIHDPEFIEISLLAYQSFKMIEEKRFESAYSSQITIQQQPQKLDIEDPVINFQDTTEPNGWDPVTSQNLGKLFEEFFIDNQSEEIRNSTLQLLSSLWIAGKQQQKEEFIKQLEEKSKTLLNYGKNNKEFFKLFSFLCSNILKDQNIKFTFKDKIKSLFTSLISIFKEGLNQLVSHPDHQLYLFLEDIVDDYSTFKPQYLEANGCLNCYGHNKQNSVKEDKLTVLQQEMRTGNNKLIIKLKKTMEIQQITLPRDSTYQKAKKNFVKQINIYLNNNLSSDMNALKSDMSLWKRVKQLNVEKETSKEYIITFPVPISAKFLCIEFNITAKLPPQCSRCPEVRAEGSGFYCSQCQYSPIIQVENTTLKYVPSSFSDIIVIDSDKSKENCEISIAEYSSIILELQRDLQKEKQKLRILYDRYYGTKCNNSIGILLNSDELDRLYQELMTNMNYLMSYRKALAQYSGVCQQSLKKQIDQNLTLGDQQHNCYGCLQSFLNIFLTQINQKQSLILFQEIVGEEEIKSFVDVIEQLYSQQGFYPQKITQKAMRIHKNIFIHAFNDKKYEYLNAFINNIKHDLLEIKQDHSLIKKNENFSNLKLRLVDLRFLQEAFKDQIEQLNTLDSLSTEEQNTLKKFQELSGKIIHLVNQVMPTFFQKGLTSSLNFQNDIIVSLLEIILSEFNNILPGGIYENRIPTSCQNCSVIDQIFQKDKSICATDKFHDSFEKRFNPRGSKIQHQTFRDTISFGNNSSYQGSFPPPPSQWRQSDFYQSREMREQVINQMLGGVPHASGISGFDRQGTTTTSWSGSGYGNFLSYQNPLQQTANQSISKETYKKKIISNRINQAQQEILSFPVGSQIQQYSIPPPSQFPGGTSQLIPPPLPSFSNHLGNILPPQISTPSRKSAGENKGSSSKAKKGQLVNQKNEQEKLLEFMTLLIGYSDQPEQSNFISSQGVYPKIVSSTHQIMEIEQFKEKIEQQTQSFKIKPDNWLQNCIQLFDSRRLQELMHTIILQIAHFNSRVACFLLLHALPDALCKQGSSMCYFELFKEVILVLNSTSSKSTHQNTASTRKLPGLSMMHQQSSEDLGLSRKELDEEAINEELEYLDILSTMFKNLDQQLKSYASLKNKQLISTKEFFIQNLNSGSSLNYLTNLIKIFIENPNIKQAFKNNNKLYMQQIISSVVSIRKFKYILNQNYYQIESLLSSLFQELQSNSFNEKQNFLKQLITALPSTSNDPLGQEFLMEQINKILIPKKLVPNLRLEVQSNQREYLPSSLPKKEISASEFGTTMNDILTRIKSELPDPSWVIEMLVANKLINNKDLPIDLVYKKVWVQSQQKGVPSNQIDWKKQVISNPMKIVYRITGFDGEAHEELVDQIVDEDQQTCSQLSKVLFDLFMDETGKETCGLASLIEIIKQIYSDSEQKSKLLSIITIMNIACKHSEGRTKALQYNGLSVILKVLMNNLPNMNESEPESLIQNLFELIHGLLEESENTKFKINQSGMEIESISADAIQEEEEECLKNVMVCIEKINKIDEKGGKNKNTQLIQDLIRILPILTHDYLKPSQFLVNNFSQAIQFEDDQIKKDNLDKINKYIEIAEKIPEDFQSFREESIRQGILEKATLAFMSVIPGYNQIDQPKAKLQKNCLKRCLAVFMGLMKGNFHVQTILNEAGILHSIYQLADPTIKIEEVGKISESLIEYIVSEKNNVDKNVQNDILKIKQEDAQKKKEKADLVKKNQLSMLTNNAQKILQNFNFNDIEEELSIKCVVCQEGYTLRPQEIMGAYIFSTQTNIADEKKLLYDPFSYSEKPSVTSATSFNCIHLKCHQDAVIADQNSKKPKGEWEGALIRNSEAKCNNWFPIKGPEIEQNQMDQGLKKYVKGIGQLGQNGQSLAWILINDFKGLLIKFANQEDIAKETRTTFEHNLKIFPFFISSVSYVLSQDDNKELLDKMNTSFQKMLNKEIKDESRKIEIIQTFLVSSIFLLTPEEWKNRVRKIFLSNILNIFVTSYFKNNADLDTRVAKYGQSIFILFTLINMIFDKIHSKAASGHQGSLLILQQKLDAYISNSYNTLIDQFQLLHSEYRDKVAKFTKVSEYLEYIGIKEEIIQLGEDVTTALLKYKE
ncbi:hypothetical protein ABPG74_006435 [Tetrahymena malaccensis]